jgi:hypothetical protein
MEPMIRRARRREAALAAVQRTVGANQLALIRAFCAPARPSTRPADASGVNYFSHCKAADVGVNACAKRHTNDRMRVKFFRKNKNYDSAETRIPSALPH